MKIVVSWLREFVDVSDKDVCGRWAIFFFYPAFTRHFKKYPRLRIVWAVFAAAFFGNMYYHCLASSTLPVADFFIFVHRGNWVIGFDESGEGGGADVGEHCGQASVRDGRAEIEDDAYRPDNAVLVVVGDFEQQQFDAWVDQYFAPLAKPDRSTPSAMRQAPCGASAFA